MPKNVSEITQRLRKIIQNNSDLQDIWIRGEILEVSPTQSGVFNFTLEGSDQKIECVIFADRVSLQENLPSVGSNVFVKGQIYVYEAVSRYRFRVTDIHPIGGSSPSPSFSINDLTNTLRSTLQSHSVVEVQGEIADFFESEAHYTILKLKDVTMDEQVNQVINCVLPPEIDPPFPLLQGDEITVKGKFDIFRRASTYRIVIDNPNRLRKRSIPRQQTPNKCQECCQRFNNLQKQLCPICYDAHLTSEGIVVGAVMRYFNSPRFANFSTKREYRIKWGAHKEGRADIALLNSEGNPVAIAECKRIGYDGNDGIVQLKGYINPTVAKLGLFADNTDPYEWTFLKKNNELHRFDPITRSQFERELGIEPAPEIPPTQTRIELIRGNIVEVEVDAIVNAADSNLTRGTGVDRAIRDAGGEEIDRACQEIFDREGVCPPGRAVITTGGELSARYVIHAVGPIYDDGEQHEAATLSRCYKNSLRLAVKEGVRSIAFPAISTGNFRYPIEKATPIALKAVKEFVEQAQQNSEMVPERIQFVLFDEKAYNCYVKEFSNLGFGLSCLIG